MGAAAASAAANLLWLSDPEHDYSYLGVEDLSLSSSSFILSSSNLDANHQLPFDNSDVTQHLDCFNNTTTTGLPDISISIPDLDLSSVDFSSILSTDNLASKDPLSWPDLSLPMYSNKTHLDTDLYNHSSPSSTTTTTVLTGPTSTPTFSLLDGSLNLSPGCSDSLFSSYDDMNNTIHTPQSNSNSNPVNTIETANPNDLLVPGLALPPKPNTGNGKAAKRGRPPSSEASVRDGSPVDVDVIVKRQRNNIAAKKYRQKKIDRIDELEQEVDDIKKERDELRIQLAKREAETAALREMLKMATAQRA